MVALADILSLLAEWAKDPLIMIEFIFEFCKVDPTFNLHFKFVISGKFILTWSFLRLWQVFPCG